MPVRQVLSTNYRSRGKQRCYRWKKGINAFARPKKARPEFVWCENQPSTNGQPKQHREWEALPVSYLTTWAVTGCQGLGIQLQRSRGKKWKKHKTKQATFLLRGKEINIHPDSSYPAWSLLTTRTTTSKTLFIHKHTHTTRYTGHHASDCCTERVKVFAIVMRKVCHILSRRVEKLRVAPRPGKDDSGVSIWLLRRSVSFPPANGARYSAWNVRIFIVPSVEIEVVWKVLHSGRKEAQLQQQTINAIVTIFLFKTRFVEERFRQSGFVDSCREWKQFESRQSLATFFLINSLQTVSFWWN